MKTLPTYLSFLPIFLKFSLLFFLTAIVGQTLAQSQQSYELDQYLWKNRLLLFFAPAEEDAWWQMHKQKLAAEHPALADRDLLYSTYFLTYGKVQGTQPIPKAYVEKMRRRYEVTPEQHVCILIGKDGGVKMQKVDKTVSMQEIFSLIDAMPMRRQEMRKKP